MKVIAIASRTPCAWDNLRVCSTGSKVCDSRSFGSAISQPQSLFDKATKSLFRLPFFCLSSESCADSNPFAWFAPSIPCLVVTIFAKSLANYCLSKGLSENCSYDITTTTVNMGIESNMIDSRFSELLMHYHTTI